jgi:hypothetical protein
MTLNTTDESNGVSRGTPTSKIQFTNAATYNVQWSGQFQNTNNSDHDVRVWLKKNGTDISGSTGFASIPSKHGQVDGHTIIGWNYILTLAAGDYLQFYWSADSTAISIQTYSVGSNPTTPSTASLIVTAQQVMNLQLGPTGPQGPAGTAGGISSVALAGTGLSITGSPVTTSGTITANVSYGTTAGTSTEGNDGRIANIGTGTIDTVGDLGIGGSINTGQTGSGSGSPGDIDTGTTGDGVGGFIKTSAVNSDGGYIDTRGYGSGSGGFINTSNNGGSISTYDGGGSINTRGTGSIGLGVTGTRTTLVGSASGSDKTITLPNATGTVALTSQATDMEITDSTKGYILNSATKRWRLTIDDNGVLLRTALTLLFLLSFMCGSQAQVRDLVYGTNNVVIGPTNTNALSFTNSVAFSNPLTFGTNAATTRTNLGVTVASNLPAPYSGAATTNSLLVANGSGSSVFVSTLPSLTIGVGTNTDVTLQRETNNSLAQRNGTNPQTLFLFNTYSNSTNYERGKIAWTNNVMTIGTEKGTGGGTARALEFSVDGTTRLTISAASGNTFISDGNSLIFTSAGRLVPTGTDGIMSLVDYQNTGWNRLNFGGTTTNFPALKRTNTALQVRLADDSAYTTLDAQLRAQGTAPTNSTAAGTAGDIRWDTNNFLYICVSSNTWRRTSLTNW